MKAKTWKLNPSKTKPGWLTVLGPFDEEFVVALKATVPFRWREFDADLRAWRIHESYADDVERVVADHSVFPPGPEPTGADAAAGFAALLTRVGPECSAEVVANIREGVLLGASEVCSAAGVSSIDVREFVCDGRRRVAIAAVVDMGAAG